jgi:hypothetical protein
MRSAFSAHLILLDLISLIFGDINEFKKGYQTRANMVKAENGDLLANSHSILNG